MNAGARTDPTLDVISTMSPWAIPPAAAVFGLISTQLLHIADVIGSGSSCSHGRCASEPSRNAYEAYGRKWNGYCPGSPANDGSVNATARAPAGAGPGAAAASARGRSPHQPPCFCAVAHASRRGVTTGPLSIRWSVGPGGWGAGERGRPPPRNTRGGARV